MILYAHVRACMRALSVIGLYVMRVTRDVILWRWKSKRRAFSGENINDRYEKSILRLQDSTYEKHPRFRKIRGENSLAHLN